MDPLHFRENGSRDKDAIVFIHGGGMTGLGWQTAMQTIPEYYCLAPDLPGSGQSAHITPLTLENAVEGLADLIRANVPSGRAAIVGLSIGANVSIGLFQKYPDLVEKAFLTGTTPRLSRLTTSMFIATIRLLLPLVRRQLRFQQRRLLLRSRNLTDDRITQIDDGVDWLTADLIKQMFDLVENQADPYGNVTPTVVLVEGKELAVSQKQARAVVNALQNGRGYLVSGLGHSWPLQKPALFR